ncbi:MAG: hypothetical protein ABJC04_09505 [Verrucomicrobiota bacterium]
MKRLDGILTFNITHGAENNIGSIVNAQADALLGVFLNNAIPALPVPGAIDFQTNKNYLNLSPALKQPFINHSDAATHRIALPVNSRTKMLTRSRRISRSCLPANRPAAI